MEESNIIVGKSFDLACASVRIANQLRENKQYELASQIIRSGTSVGANVNEAVESEYPKEFLHSMSIAKKEAAETMYWFKLLLNLHIDCSVSDLDFELARENLRLLKSIVRTKRNNLNQHKD